MIWYFVIAGFAFASGFASGWIERMERVCRRFAKDPAGMQDELRYQVRKRGL